MLDGLKDFKTLLKTRDVATFTKKFLDSVKIITTGMHVQIKNAQHDTKMMAEEAYRQGLSVRIIE